MKYLSVQKNNTDDSKNRTRMKMTIQPETVEYFLSTTPTQTCVLPRKVEELELEHSILIVSYYLLFHFLLVILLLQADYPVEK